MPTRNLQLIRGMQTGKQEEKNEFLWSSGETEV